jgi:hypothetical protein
MIPSGVEIYVGLEPIDLRWGFDRLSGLWRNESDVQLVAAHCSCSSGCERAR